MKTIIETSDYSVEQWQQMYDDAGSIAKLAKVMGRHQTTIQTHLHKAGVVIKPPSVTSSAKIRRDMYSKDEWQEMYINAGSLKALARQLEMSSGAIRYHLENAGVEIKSKGFKSPRCKQVAKGSAHHNWKGGVYIRGGYILEYAPDHPAAAAQKGYVAQHRLVMERHLGRFLTDDEDVHHKNENKLDNQLENLELITHPEHMRYHAQRRTRNERGRFSK